VWNNVRFSSGAPAEGWTRLCIRGFENWESKENQKSGIRVCLRTIPDSFGRDISVLENEFISRDGMFVQVLEAARDGRRIDFENESVEKLIFETTGKELYGLIAHRTSKGKVFPQIKQVLSIREYETQITERTARLPNQLPVPTKGDEDIDNFA
jgi:hypothetical protein